MDLPKTCFSAMTDVFCALLTGKLEHPITMSRVFSVPYIRGMVHLDDSLGTVMRIWEWKVAAVRKPALVRILDILA